MYWTLELASKLEDAPWPATKEELLDYAYRTGAPAELMEISILHKKAKLLSEIAVGDTLLICDKVFNITAIGDEALHTFKEMGHCTICFKGGSVPERPGCIMVEGDVLQEADIQAGGLIEIY